MHLFTVTFWQFRERHPWIGLYPSHPVVGAVVRIYMCVCVFCFACVMHVFCLLIATISVCFRFATFKVLFSCTLE